jgi:acetyl esterase/lipase
MNFYAAALISVLSITLSASTSGARADDTYANPKAIDMLEWLPSSPPDHRILYDTNPSTFGELHLPKNTAPGPHGFPVVAWIHGGGWTADWTIAHTDPLVDALTKQGIATWSIEYRRLGNVGGGFPNTFLDVAHAVDFLRKIAPQYKLDLNRVVVAGHSSGGHLALWVAGRGNIPKDSALYVSDPLPLKGVVSLAGVVDLETAMTVGGRKDALELLNVQDAAAAAPLWPTTNPARLLPFHIPQILIVGTKDNPWRVTITKTFAETATQKSDTVSLIIPEGANHFDMVDAKGPAFPIFAKNVKMLLGIPEDSAK